MTVQMFQSNNNVLHKDHNNRLKHFKGAEGEMNFLFIIDQLVKVGMCEYMGMTVISIQAVMEAIRHNHLHTVTIILKLTPLLPSSLTTLSLTFQISYNQTHPRSVTQGYRALSEEYYSTLVVTEIMFNLSIMEPSIMEMSSTTHLL